MHCYAMVQYAMVQHAIFQHAIVQAACSWSLGYGFCSDLVE